MFCGLTGTSPVQRPWSPKTIVGDPPRSNMCAFSKEKLFLAVLGLRCCVWAFSSYSEWGLLFVGVHRLLIVVASLVVEQTLGTQASVPATPGHYSTASVVMTQGPSCPAAESVL